MKSMHIMGTQVAVGGKIENDQIKEILHRIDSKQNQGAIVSFQTAKTLPITFLVKTSCSVEDLNDMEGLYLKFDPITEEFVILIRISVEHFKLYVIPKSTIEPI